MLSLLFAILSLLPINTGRIFVTSDFGEARPLRYHMGIDFSTHGKIGLPVYAIDSGVIVRIKRSYYGYGNAVYLMTSDSSIYVYAHLDRFIDPLEDTVFKAQMSTQRYRQDIYFDETSLHVKRGEIIGYSGESGVGYPHLHFEKRIGWLMPVFPLEDTIPLYPALKGIFMTTPSANYQILDIKFHRILLPHAERFKLFLLVSHVKEIKIMHDSDTVFCFSIDTLNYLKQRESGLLFKPKNGSFKGFIRTNFDSFRPSVVKKSQREYRLKDGGEMTVELVSFYGDTSRYTLLFTRDLRKDVFFYKTYEGIPYSFSDYGIHVSEKAKKMGYRFAQFGKDTMIIIGNSRIYAEINPGYLPYLRGIFYRSNGDSLFIYPELPQITGYVYVKSRDTMMQVYRITQNGKKYITKTLKLGAFVALNDTVPPYIKFVGKNDSIAFYVDDKLSGVEADSMSLYVNGKWYPVYYDFERKIAVLRYPLSRGKYNVRFRVLDRAHNVGLWEKKVYIR